MTHKMALPLALVVATVTAVPARADVGLVLDRVSAASQIVRVDALDVKDTLERRDVNLIGVLQQVAALNSRVEAFRTVLAELQAHADQLTAAQRESLEHAHVAVETLQALLNRKSAMLSNVDTASSNRRTLRDTAAGVARRAEMLDLRIARLRG